MSQFAASSPLSSIVVVGGIGNWAPLDALRELGWLPSGIFRTEGTNGGFFTRSITAVEKVMKNIVER
jgi:hypothetical protein